jgi:hypothetical protein
MTSVWATSWDGSGGGLYTRPPPILFCCSSGSCPLTFFAISFSLGVPPSVHTCFSSQQKNVASAAPSALCASTMPRSSASFLIDFGSASGEGRSRAEEPAARRRAYVTCGAEVGVR